MPTNPQEMFLMALVAAMMDAAKDRKLTQFHTTIDPSATGTGPIKRVRIVVIPDELDYVFPVDKPLGA